MPLPAFLSLLGGAGAAGAGAAGSAGLLKMLPSALNTATGAGLTKGIPQLLKSMQSKKQADAAMPPAYDAQQLAMLSQVQQKVNALRTGSAFASSMGAIDSSSAGTQEAITQVTGGDVGGTIQALLSSQSAANRAKNQVLAQGDQMQYAYTGLAKTMQDDISSRAMELSLALRQQKLAEWAQGKTDATANIYNAAARAGDGEGGGSKINWADIFTRSRTPSSGPMFTVNPEQQARQLSPEQPFLPLSDDLTGDDEPTIADTLQLLQPK